MSKPDEREFWELAVRSQNALVNAIHGFTSDPVTLQRHRDAMADLWPARVLEKLEQAALLRPNQSVRELIASVRNCGPLTRKDLFTWLGIR